MKRAKVSEELVLDMKRTILSGKYAPGTQIASERELAEKYNVSRIPIREAIEQLVKENILETKPYIGTFVTNLENVNLVSEDIYKLSHIEKKIIKNSLAVRELVESECARLAATHATDDELKEIQQHLFSSIDDFRKIASKKQNSFLKSDYNFHLAIAKAAHNEILYNLFIEMSDTISFHQFCSLRQDVNFDTIPNSHLNIYNAILLKNPIEAHNAMKQHLTQLSELVSNLIT